jgi:spermidine/putrescine transport system substrate-binding protein
MTSFNLRSRASRRSLLKGLGAAAVGLSFGPTLAGCGQSGGGGSGGGGGGKLNFYNWDTYIGETTLADFKAASGIDVNMSLFASNDELFAKLKAGNQGYDVIVPSNDFVERMAQADMLLPLDHSKIPNMSNIAPEFIDVAYDQGRKFSMPYTWLVLGIGYRKSKMKGGKIPDSWGYIYDKPDYAGRIAVLSEAGDMFRLGFKYLGKSVNDKDPALIKQVEDMLIKQKANIKKFHEDDGQDLLLAGEVDVVIEYNGDIAQAMEEDPDIGFVVPNEGSQLNSDNLCIPKGAPNVENAHKFIDFLLDGKTGAEISKTILYPTPNTMARGLMDPSYQNNPVIFPPYELLNKCEYAAFPGPDIQRAFEEAMTRVRSA